MWGLVVGIQAFDDCALLAPAFVVFVEMRHQMMSISRLVNSEELVCLEKCQRQQDSYSPLRNARRETFSLSGWNVWQGG